MNNKIEVIGIDHGWSNIKTSSQVFVTGVKEITTEPALYDGVLEYKGRYYKVGGNRQEVKSTKAEDDTFYLLTLAAVAKELRRRGLCEAKVFLAVGLPLTRFGSEKSEFVKYLTAEKDIEFLFENIRYHVVIENVAVFPQCYAAIAGVILARRLMVPIAKATEITREISEGNYAIRFESDVRTQELTELSNAVNHMAGCLEKQEAIRRRLTSDVAHELRTPIANVSSHLEAIIEGVWEPTTERLQSCYDELGRISDIISDLEKLRQIEDENMILEKEPVDLLELSQTVQYAFEQELNKKQLKCKVSGEFAVVSGDQKRLHQVIFNLVSNAIKYSTEGGCINIDVRNETDTATLIIEDQGIGISEKDLPLIFERFYRTDRSSNRKTGGAGIGLTIVKAIIHAHDGNIKVESKEGYGSKFTITLHKG